MSRKPKTKKKSSLSCSPGKFRNSPMIQQIVGRVHVADTTEDAIKYVKSRLAAGAWSKMSSADRRALECEVTRQHRANRKFYMGVMRPSYR